MQSADSLQHGPCGAIGFPIRVPPAGCPYDAATSWFTCGPEIGEDGITRTFAYQFLDAGGAPESAYDSVSTASIHVTSHRGGTVTRNGRTSGVEDDRDLTLSGLEGDETTRTWNGAGSSSRRDSTTGSARTASSVTTIADVVVPAPFARDSWPLSGTITTHLVTSDGIDQTSVITFNGTRNVPLTIGGVTVTIDLARRLGGPGGPTGGPPPRHGPGGPGGPGGPPPPGGRW